MWSLKQTNINTFTGRQTMKTLSQIASRLFSTKTDYDAIAIGQMTDIQMHRAGVSKAVFLHQTFSGLSTCN
jgi:hypothetical protein